MTKVNYDELFASRMSDLKPGAIREILKVLSDKSILSLAAGMPANEALPSNLLVELTEQALEEFGDQLLQYGNTEGLMPYREAVSAHITKHKGIELAQENFAVATGAQGGLNEVAMMFISPGDTIAVESPTFLAANKCFKAYEPNIIEIKSDEYGLMPEELEDCASKNQLKFLYVIPNFQNPSGITTTLERRKAILELAEKYNFMVLEDDPYFELRFDGEHVPSMYSMAPERVVHVGSLSKIMAPGLRLGYIVAEPSLITKLNSLKQGVDVHASNLDQALAAIYLRDGHFDKQIAKILETYKSRRDVMLDALEQHMPEGFEWSRPEGGMFIWVRGPEDFDAEAAYHRAIDAKVAYVPGQFFHLDQENNKNTLRLNFTSPDEETIARAVETLSRVFAS